jgi:lipopolysaccharide transport system ATP-binding protein
MSNIAIQVKHLTKIYKLYDKPVDRLKEALHPLKKKYHKDFYALNDVSFEIKKGETVGIIGKNGAGKSTLLKIITGVLTPTSGSIHVNGRIASLLELGAGFNPEYTGVENIYFQGSLMGYTRAEMESKIDDILAFADIGDFVHQPVKMYSSGMFARLAFAVAINVDPDILIVDEVLSVGDMFFQAKALSRMKALINNSNTTVLFVSHDMASVKALCENAIYINHGTMELYGEASEVAERYFSEKFEIKEDIVNQDMDTSRQSDYSNEEFIKTSSFQRIQNGKATFTNVLLLDENKQQIRLAKFGQTVIIRYFVEVYENIHNLVFAFHIRDRNGVELIYDDTLLCNYPVLSAEIGESLIVDWKFTINLQASAYNIAAMMSIPINLEVGNVDICDFIPIASQFEVESPNKYIYAAICANSELSILKENSND